MSTSGRKPPSDPPPLGVHDHSRDSAGLTYVYPVVSRRAQGLSIGINLNTNNACNWACSYCQVPDLTRGAAPPVDLTRLAAELSGFLDEVLDGDFMLRRVPEGLRRLNDLAFSGNGEPTASPQFAQACDLVLSELARRNLATRPRIVVISNGSQLGRASVRASLARLAQQRGELWFKLDRGLPDGRLTANGVELSDRLLRTRLAQAATCIPTWLQTCLFSVDGAPPSMAERGAYLALVKDSLRAGVTLAGVLLYSLARPSLQPGAERLAALPAAALDEWAVPLRALGLEVRVTA